MAATDHLHPDLFENQGRYSPPNWRAMAPDMRSDRSADTAGPMHGPAEPPVHGPPKPRATPHVSAGIRRKAFDFGGGEPTQLPMFMGARDLKATINESYDRSPVGDYASHYGLSTEDRESGEFAHEHEELDEMWGRKLAESKMGPETGVHGSGVHESISREGYRPHSFVTLNWNRDEGGGGDDVRVHEAHHRIAAAADIEEQSKGKRDVWIRTQHNTQDYH